MKDGMTPSVIIWKLEVQKPNLQNDILKLNSAINQLESSLPFPQRGEEKNQERRWYDKNGNLYPIEYPQPDTDWYSLDISYTYELLLVTQFISD